MVPVREYVRSSGGDPEIMRKAQEEVRPLDPHFDIAIYDSFAHRFPLLCHFF